jgi:ADP-ribose pyrophosphatase YjhB (NUDIX family)
VSERRQAEPPVVAAAGAVVVDRGGRVLLVKRGRPPSLGSWTLPGGRLEAGESPEAAVVREVAEETEVRARVVCPLGVVRIAREGFLFAIHEHLLVPLDERRAQPRAGDDAAEARWVERSELEVLGVAPDAVAVVDRGLAEALSRRLAPTR